MTRGLELPKVFVKQVGKKYEVHWDDCSTEAENVIHENHLYVLGYITGCIDSLNDGGSKIGCLSSNTGTIRNLSKNDAEKLCALITNLLHPMVINRYKKLKKEEKHQKFLKRLHSIEL